MSAARILLLYISEHSGHHCASAAIERALIELEPTIETRNINSFNYTNPLLEKIINRAYMSVVKRTPEVWEYLYDNPKVLKKTQRLRETFHKFNTGKLKTLLDELRPHAVICTQAFPCGMVAEYKRTTGINIPLIGVLTDYAPHSYWIYPDVDRYAVPSEATGRKLIDNGVDPRKILACGIPIDSKFSREHDGGRILAKLGLTGELPRVLVMGGTQGLGPIADVIRVLDRSRFETQIIVACGTNQKLFRWLRASRFHKKIVALPYADNVDELMAVSTVIITKPGGITTAEALARGLPMLIIHPLPGQEAMNTRFLLGEGVAIKAETPQDAAVLLEELLYNDAKRMTMSARARELSKPDSAIVIARATLELAGG